METVEFIESYKRVGNDYQWNDNHGELIRCRDCKYYNNDGLELKDIGWCELNSKIYPSGEWDMWDEDDFCSRGERKDE